MAKKIGDDGKKNVYIRHNEEDYGQILLDKNEEQEEVKHKKHIGGKLKKPDVKNVHWSRLRPVLMIVIPVLVVFVIGFVGITSLASYIFDPVDENDTQTIEVKIPQASSTSTIAEILEDAGVVRNKLVFKLYADFSESSYKLKAGTYELSKSMTMDDILFELMQGNQVNNVMDITITEGMTVEDIANYLVDVGIFKNSNRFLEICKSGEGFTDEYYISQAVSEGKAKNFVMEGYLFPDTYNIYVDSTEETIISKLYDRFGQIWTDEYTQRAEELGMSVDEVITLASIIEKEAKTDQFAQVSAVFHNRLNADMPLGSCATMQAVTGEKKYVFSQAELDIDSPYNTYKYTGLPAGPICNPGNAAILAALYPDEEFMNEGYMYFCLTDPATGEQVFAKTYEEHLANQAQWESYWQ